jgi:hypothetical protein
MKPISGSAQTELRFPPYHETQGEDTAMLTSFVIDMLLGCTLVLVASWVQDAVQAWAKVDPPHTSSANWENPGPRCTR